MSRDEQQRAVPTNTAGIGPNMRAGLAVGAGHVAEPGAGRGLAVAVLGRPAPTG